MLRLAVSAILLALSLPVSALAESPRVVPDIDTKCYPYWNATQLSLDDGTLIRRIGFAKVIDLIDEIETNSGDTVLTLKEELNTKVWHFLKVTAPQLPFTKDYRGPHRHCTQVLIWDERNVINKDKYYTNKALIGQ